MRRWLAGVLVVAALSATGCGGDESYCDRVKDEADSLGRISEQGGPGAFLKALPTLEELADNAPSDLKDEWQTFIDALHGLRDALADAGVDADQLGSKLPAGLTPAERRRIHGSAALLASPEVIAAVRGIEQQAKDVCKTPLL